MTLATVITDASFCPKTKAAGWAAWVRIDGEAEPVKRYGELKTPVDRAQHAELLAAVNGIWLAMKYGATEVLVQTDCLEVVHLLEGKTRKASLISRFTLALREAGVEHIMRSGRHVKGHTTVEDARSYVNRWCDEKAKSAMRKGRAA